MGEGIQAICGYAGCEVVEMSVQRDHVHTIVMVFPKVAISDLMGRVKGQTSIRVFKQFRNLRKKPYWGNHFWAKGYCVDTVGLDSEMIRSYGVKVKRVVERVYNPWRLRKAWQQVRKNAGAAEVVRMTVEAFERREEELLQLIDDKLKAGS